MCVYHLYVYVCVYLMVSALLDKIIGKNERREHTSLTLTRLLGIFPARGVFRDQFHVCVACLFQGRTEDLLALECVAFALDTNTQNAGVRGQWCWTCDFLVLFVTLVHFLGL